MPRDTLRLVGTPDAPRLVEEKTGEDLTARMQRYSRDRVREGCSLGRSSPRCPHFPWRRRAGSTTRRSGRTHRARLRRRALAQLPEDPAARARPRGLHTAHKFAVLAHGPAHYARLGRLAAAAGRAFTHAPLDEYQAQLMEGHAVRATRSRHANVLTHMTGYFKRALGTDQRAELVEVIDEYRRGA